MSMASDAELEILESTPDHAIGRWRSAGLYVWRGVTTVHGASVLQRAVARMREGDPTGPGVLLGVVEAGTPPPAADVRRALADFLAGAGGYVRVSALAFEGTGFQASMVRAVATGLALLGRPDYPHQVFASVEEGARWIERTLRLAGTPRYQAPELAAAIAQLRSAHRTS